MTTLREQLIEQLSKPVVSPVKFGGQDVFIKHWTEAEKMAWNAIARGLDINDPNNLWRAEAVIHSLCDADGTMIFSPDDYKALGSFPANEIAPVFDAIMEINADPEDEDAKKNSETPPTSNSSSASPVI